MVYTDISIHVFYFLIANLLDSLGYARQDRKMQARVPISAADVARLLEAMGVDRVIAVDLHCGQIQGFFGPRVPVDNLDGGTVGVSYFGDIDLVNPVIVSPDAGGVYRAKQFREVSAALMSNIHTYSHRKKVV